MTDYVSDWYGWGDGCREHNRGREAIPRRALVRPARAQAHANPADDPDRGAAPLRREGLRTHDGGGDRRRGGDLAPYVLSLLPEQRGRRHVGRVRPPRTRAPGSTAGRGAARGILPRDHPRVAG